MEHERCYIYSPAQTEERVTKRQRTSKHDPQAHLEDRLQIYRDLWAEQEDRLQTTLETADSAVQQDIVNFISVSTLAASETKAAIPTALIVAGPSIASHGPFFGRLGRRVKENADSAYAILTSGECPNLKTLLKNLIKKVTSRVEDDDEDEEDMGRRPTSNRRGPKLLNYDLEHIQEWRRKTRVSSIVVALQDSEAFDTSLLVDIVDLLHSWLDRLPFVLLLGIATSADNLENRFSGTTLRYLEGEKFDVTQSDEIIEKLFRTTVANTDVRVRIGPSLCSRMLERQKDHVQNTQDFCDGLKYAYMSHFYATVPTVFLKENIAFEDLSSDAFAAVRTLPSFRRRIEEMLEQRRAQDVRELLENDQALYHEIVAGIQISQESLSALSNAAQVLSSIRNVLQMSPTVRLSSIWTRAASGEIHGSPIFRETMLYIKRIPSDRLVQLLVALKEHEGEFFTSIDSLQEDLDKMINSYDSTVPLRTQHDVRNDSLRTTVVAQKVLLNKHKAALSEQDKAYSDLVGRFHDGLETYFASFFIDPRTLFLTELLMYDLKSPHTEVFQPRPRFSVERALASPHDYLNCDCCTGVEGNEAALSATQPATAIVYQMYLESGPLINVSDLWSAFNAIAGDPDDENEPKTRALFQRALAELKYLGLTKPSRKKTDHITKTTWKGL